MRQKCTFRFWQSRFSKEFQTALSFVSTLSSFLTVSVLKMSSMFASTFTAEFRRIHKVEKNLLQKCLNYRNGVNLINPC